MWGSNQAALSLAIWSKTRHPQDLEPTYNYPLTLHGQINPELKDRIFPNLVHVHYHWLLEDDSSKNPLFDASGPLSLDQRVWLSSATSGDQTPNACSD